MTKAEVIDKVAEITGRAWGIFITYKVGDSAIKHFNNGIAELQNMIEELDDPADKEPCDLCDPNAEYKLKKKAVMGGYVRPINYCPNCGRYLGGSLCLQVYRHISAANYKLLPNDSF